jgi:formylglycine-generating enzyme required for sulfatase activity
MLYRLIKQFQSWRWLLPLLGCLFLLPVQAQQALNTGKRLALVIGNDNYQNTVPLKNARADAQAMAAKLQSLGFAVTLSEDASEKDMQRALRTFKNTVRGGDEVVVFYSGHGVELEGSNYLLPIDIRGESPDQVKDDAIPLQRVLADLADQKARFTLAIIDACRDNPFKGTGRAIGGRGLAPTTVATGQMVIYSAGAGQQALDKLGNNDRESNGVFTRVFLREMSQPGQQVRDVLHKVREEVARMAQGVGHQQVPALYDQALGEFYFLGATTVTVQVPPQPAPVTKADPEEEAWSAAKDSNNTTAIQIYLDQYPRGRYTVAAKVLLAKLKPAPVAVVSAPVPVTPAKRPPSAAEIEQEAWENASDSNSIEVLEEYLKQYPKGHYAKQARVQITRLKIEIKQAAIEQKQASTYASAAPKTGKAFRDCPECPEMMALPPGSFMMGSETDWSAKPVHTVNINYALAVGKYEVTFDEWDACIASGGCTWKPGDDGDGRGRHPVINVSWDDVQVYLRWLTRKTGKQYRLLTEAEWEYAARAGTSTEYFWGNEVGHNQANCTGCGSQWDKKSTAPVGSFKPNSFGLFDMHGNVGEWVQDRRIGYDKTPRDGSAAELQNDPYRIYRGGYYYHEPQDIRSAARNNYYQDNRGRHSMIGFRVARGL